MFQTNQQARCLVPPLVGAPPQTPPLPAFVAELPESVVLMGKSGALGHHISRLAESEPPEAFIERVLTVSSFLLLPSFFGVRHKT